MDDLNQTRVAWLLPAMGTGGISFQHLLCEFTQKFPQTMVFTGQWPGFAAGFDRTFQVREVGATKHIELGWAASGYRSSISLMSPQIIGHLFKFKPQTIFTNAFSIWTLMALLLQPLGGWKTIVICEGISPSIDYRDSPLRLLSRRLIARLADAFVVNGRVAKAYLVDVLGAPADRVFARPFLVPSLEAMLQCPDDKAISIDPQLQQPIFLFVGQIVPRKGLKVLLEACSLLKQQGYQDFTLLVVGDGEQRQELEDFAKSRELGDRVKWVGRVDYSCLGRYFQAADVFVFPTHEDIWGMVLTEAMAFGKAALCSQGAGSVEMVIDGENGFVFDPNNPQQLAEYMCRFLETPMLIEAMGKRSQQIMNENTPQDATESFFEAIKFINASKN
jgi:glycosyltransferase involved in cell wall biosynthesis